MTEPTPSPNERMVRVDSQDGVESRVPKDVLDKARIATFNKRPSKPQAQDWVDEVAKATLAIEAQHEPRDRARKQKDLESFNRACAAFALDLVQHSGNEAAHGFAYRPFDRTELSFTLVSETHFEQITKLWLVCGWIDVSGFIDTRSDWNGKVHDDGKSRVRRYRATPSLLEHALQFGLTPSNVRDHFKVDLSKTDIIQFRRKRSTNSGALHRGKRVRLTGPDVDAQRAKIERLNRHMQAHDFSLDDTPMIRRLFNCVDRPGFDLNLGGRLYCLSEDAWMEKPKEERAQILIDGQATVEIDVRASHLSILYALSGEELDLSQDPYAIGNCSRDIVKKIIVTAIGAGRMPRRWPRNFNDEYEAEHGWKPKDRYVLKDLVGMILLRHPVLENLETDVLDWANLQFEESECFLSAMLTLHEEHGVPSLPVHDSLIVRVQDAEVTEEALKEAYHNRFGFYPSLSRS